MGVGREGRDGEGLTNAQIFPVFGRADFRTNGRMDFPFSTARIFARIFERVVARIRHGFFTDFPSSLACGFL